MLMGTLNISTLSQARALLLQYYFIISSSTHLISTNVKQTFEMKETIALRNKRIYGNDNNNNPPVSLSTQGSGLLPGASTELRNVFAVHLHS